MATAEYCHKIYNTHHLANLALLTEFEKNLNDIYLAYTTKKEVLFDQIHTSATTRLGQNLLLKEQLNTAFADFTTVTQSSGEHFKSLPVCTDIHFLGNDQTIPLPSAPPPFLTYEEEKVTKPTYLSKVGSFKSLPKEEKQIGRKNVTLLY